MGQQSQKRKKATQTMKNKGSVRNRNFGTNKKDGEDDDTDDAPKRTKTTKTIQTAIYGGPERENPCRACRDPQRYHEAHIVTCPTS